MFLERDQRLSGDDLIEFLNISDDIVVLTNGSPINSGFTYKVYQILKDSTVHQRSEHEILEATGNGSSIPEVVDHEMKYLSSKDCKLRTVYIVEQYT